MSNFTCGHCGAVRIDTPDGYITGCEHYPADGEYALQFFISPDSKSVRWMKVYEKQQLHPDWIDATDWPDEQLEKFILEGASHDNR